jgi:hypothetical protein
VVDAQLVVRASTGTPFTDTEGDAPRRYHVFCIHPPRAGLGNG